LQPCFEKVERKTEEGRKKTCNRRTGCSTNKLFYKRLNVCLRLSKQTQTVDSINKSKLRG
jgi:hypothetical protein